MLPNSSNGMYEHYLVDMQTEVTISDTVCNIIKTRRKKQQNDSEEVWRVASWTQKSVDHDV